MYLLQQIFSRYGNAGRRYKTAGQRSGTVDQSDPRELDEQNKKLEILSTAFPLDVSKKNIEPVSHILRKYFQSAEVYVPDVLVILHHRECRGGWGWRQHGRYVKTRIEKTTSFIVVQSLDFPPEHTHLHLIRCIDTYEKFPWITFYCLPLITRCQNSKLGQ